MFNFVILYIHVGQCLLFNSVPEFVGVLLNSFAETTVSVGGM